MPQIRGKQITSQSITDAQIADGAITITKIGVLTDTIELGSGLVNPALHAEFTTGEDLTLGIGTLEITNFSNNRALTVDVDNGFQVQNTSSGAEAYILPGTISLFGASLSPALPTQDEHVTTKAYVDDNSGTLASSDTSLTPNITTGNLSDTGITISNTPSGHGTVFVHINGSLVPVSTDPIQPAGSCFFTPDGGTTIRNFGSISAGDSLYWNGILAGYELDGGDKVTLVYEYI